MDPLTNKEQSESAISQVERKLSFNCTPADETTNESNLQIDNSDTADAKGTGTTELHTVITKSSTEADVYSTTAQQPPDYEATGGKDYVEEHRGEQKDEGVKQQLDTDTQPPTSKAPNDSLLPDQKALETTVEGALSNSPLPVKEQNEVEVPSRAESEGPEVTEGLFYSVQESSEDDNEVGTHRHTPPDKTSTEPGSYGFEETNGQIARQTDHSGSSDEDDSIEDQEERQQLREHLIEQYRQAVIEHKIARETNLQLQTKLAEYFRRKKADAVEQQSATSSVGGSTADGAVDYEQRYNKYIVSLTELRRQYQTMETTYHKQIEELKNVCAQRQQEVEEAYKEFTNYKYNIGKKALHSRTGRPINPKELLAMLAAEQKKETIVMSVRLENIKLRNEVAKVEAILKSKEELAEGLHLIDFEQLKIENQTYNEKIEERNEELSKLKKKISSTVQIMTHVKEKLQAVQYDNAKQRQRLGIADAELTFNRDQLTRLKQARDHLRAENSRLRRSCGLLGKSALLFNYEDSVDAVNSKRAALEETKRITLSYKNRTKSLQDKISSIREKGAQR